MAARGGNAATKLAFITMCLVWLTACRDSWRMSEATRSADALARARALAAPLTLTRHGLAVGEAIQPVRLECDDARSRIVAPLEIPQLVTFTTPGDCSACETHLAGVEMLLSDNSPIPEHVWVAYPADVDSNAASEQYRLITRFPICWDRAGAMWTRYNISHTPFTVLLRNGKVLLIDDASLARPSERARFMDTVRALLR